MAPDLRFRTSVTGLARDAAKRWWAIVPTLLLGTVDVFERVVGFPVNPPYWLIWIVLAGSVVLVLVLAYHDVRVVGVKALGVTEGERDSSRAALDDRDRRRADADLVLEAWSKEPRLY